MFKPLSQATRDEPGHCRKLAPSTWPPRGTPKANPLTRQLLKKLAIWAHLSYNVAQGDNP
jgi:hypothetical protein